MLRMRYTKLNYFFHSFISLILSSSYSSFIPSFNSFMSFFYFLFSPEISYKKGQGETKQFFEHILVDTATDRNYFKVERSTRLANDTWARGILVLFRRLNKREHADTSFPHVLVLAQELLKWLKTFREHLR